MIKLIFLGSGAAFTTDPNNYQSNMMISTSDHKNLLIDCGGDARHALTEQGFKADDIDAVYISHLHADHIGGLEWFGFSRKFLSAINKPTLYAHHDVLKDLWEKSLQGGMSTLENVDATLEDFFKPISLSTKTGFTWEKIKFTVFRTHHVLVNDRFMPSFGLYFSANGQNILLSTDSQYTPDLLSKYYETADIIFHDCETASPPSSAHAHYNDLKTLPDKIKNKMWLYDYNDGEKPDAIADGFKGYVVKGQIFSF